ncbi:hypothetical protein KAW80_02090 [Candidatus Babeliales bacterium]|nr:hypothetical protein [Candidatus Babeliales bacterium]
MEQKNTKIIPFGPITENIKVPLNEALKSLNLLKSDLESKRTIVLEKSQSIKKALGQLEKSKVLKINSELIEHFSKTEENYSQITNLLAQEIGFHIDFYSKYFSEEHPKEINLHQDDDANTFEEHVFKASKLLKKLSKKRQRELDIIFSRYENSLNSELRRLGNVQNYIKAQQKSA